MKSKAKTLMTLRLLQEYTDEETEITASELLKALADKGAKVSRPTLREDISALQEAGYEIRTREVPGEATYYRYIERDWTADELQILIDAVASGQFITVAKSNEIIRKLRSMAGPSEREHLIPAIAVEERHKAENESICRNVYKIQQAILNDEKIRFRHYEYNMDLQSVPKHDGFEYVVSPYAMVWKNDRYYLIGFSEKHGKPVQFRIDRMGLPNQVIDKETKQPVRRDPPPEGFVLKDRTDKVFAMFDGKKETVKLRCTSHLVSQVIDLFGKQLEITGKTADTFDVTHEVYVSPTFYAWVFQYAGGIRILEPKWVREEYMRYLKQAMEEIAGE